MRKMLLTATLVVLMGALATQAVAAIELWGLYATAGGGTIKRYNPDTGTLIGTTSAGGSASYLTQGPDGRIYVSRPTNSYKDYAVDVYNPDGTSAGVFATGSCGAGPEGGTRDLKFGPDGNLYLNTFMWNSDFTVVTNKIMKLNGSTGANEGTLVSVAGEKWAALSFSSNGLWPLFATNTSDSSYVRAAKINADGTYTEGDAYAVIRESYTLDTHGDYMYIASHSEGNVGVWDQASNSMPGYPDSWNATTDTSEKFLMGMAFYGDDTLFIGTGWPSGPYPIRKYTGTGGIGSYSLVNATFIGDPDVGPIRDLLLVGAAPPPPAHNPGDVNDDDFVGGADLTQILTNWGMSGANWGDGDVAPYPGGDDFVGGADYTEVLTYWGTSYAPQAIPEPATLGLLLLSGLAGLIRRRG